MKNNKLKKMEHVWTVVCQSAVIDSLSNRISLNNVLEDMRISKAPDIPNELIPAKGTKFTIPYSFEVVTLWRRIGGGGKAVAFDSQIEIFDPSGQSLFEFVHQVKFKEGKLRVRDIVTFKAFQVTEPGEYSFKLSARDSSLKKFIVASENYVMVKFEF